MHQLYRAAIVCGLLAVSVVPAAGSTVTGISVSPTTADAGATLTATVTGAEGYCGAVHIDWGDGTAVTHATEKLPFSQTHVYKGGGTFTVRAQGMGNCTGEATTTVTIKGPPVVAQLTSIAVSPSPATPGTPVRISLQGTGTCRMTIDFGDGNTEQLERGLPATVPHTYTQPGGYTVAVQPDAACGERRTTSLEVTGKEAPPRLTGIEISPPGQAQPGQRTIRVNGDGTCRYTIDFGDGNMETRTRALPETLQHDYPIAGRYEIVATATDRCSGTARSSVTVERETRGATRGQVSRVDVRPQVVRSGESVAIAVAGTGTCRVTVDFDDGDARTVTTALPARFTHRFKATGDYQVVVWADEPCTGVGEAMVRVR
jgi:plastocyanin